MSDSDLFTYVSVEDCERHANVRPTFAQQAVRYKEREALTNDPEKAAHVAKVFLRRDLTMHQLCNSYGPLHRGVIKCEYNHHFTFNRWNPSAMIPRERSVVELEYRLDFTGKMRICVLTPFYSTETSTNPRRHLYGWASKCLENAEAEDSILALKSMGSGKGHKVRGYIVPGDSFVEKYMTPTAPHTVSVKIDPDDIPIAPAADRWKAMRERMRQACTVEKVSYVVHWRADCPDDLDFGVTPGPNYK